jgi:hypothetical protein
VGLCWMSHFYEERQWGKCVQPQEKFGGKTHGCQEFEPMEDNSKNCEVCGCARGFHEKIVPGVAPELPPPVRSSAIGAEAVSKPLGSSPYRVEGLPEQDESCKVMEQPLKRAKTVEKGDSSKAAVKENELEKLDSCPAVTRNSMATLLKSYPAEKYGFYELRLNDHSGNWEVWCKPCKSWNKVNKDNKTVSNFKGHLKGDKHAKNVEAQQTREAEAVEKVAREQADLKSKRAELISRYASAGKY